MKILGIEIEWLGHASFKVKAKKKIIYIDPFKLNTGDKADLILITHDHFDHCSIEDLKKILKNETMIVFPKDCTEKLKSLLPDSNLISVSPFEKIKVLDFEIETFPAYNKNKKFHPKSSNWVGYVINAGKKIYHAGDTDLIEEMKKVHAEIALLPVSGTYVMTAEEAVEAAYIIKPKVAVPMHYGSLVGTNEDAAKFKELLEQRGIKVVIL